MTLTEYENGIKEIEENAKLKNDILTRDFCFSNNPHKVGDIIKDHVISMRIEKIKFQYGYYGSPPQCVYYGVIINKDGTDRKKNGEGCIAQSNIKP